MILEGGSFSLGLAIGFIFVVALWAIQREQSSEFMEVQKKTLENVTNKLEELEKVKNERTKKTSE